MEELFRFSVVRAVTKSTPSVVPSVTTTTNDSERSTPQNSLTTFQTSIQSTVQNLVAASVDSETVWGRIEPLAAQFLIANAPIALTSTLWNDLSSLLGALNDLASHQSPTPIDDAALQAVVDQFPSLTPAATAAYRSKLSDLFLAFLIVRRGGPSALSKLGTSLPTLAALLRSAPTMPEIASCLSVCAVVMNGVTSLAPVNATSAADAQTQFRALLKAAVTATVLLPPGVLSPLPKPVLGVGFRELQVVKQNIRRYQLGEIARIENILKGESRSHVQRHTLSTETDTTDSTSTTTTTDKELTTDDRTDVRSQANQEVQNDTNLKAGVQAEYSGPSYKLQADLNVSYANSRKNTNQYSADTAKDVTQKAAASVTEIVTHTQTTKVIEAFYDTERHSFNNTVGTANVSGVYQWVEKVYLCQVFNLGRHMLIDITVPEPGANLLALATTTPDLDPPPVQPHPLGTIKVGAHGGPVLDSYGRMQLDTPLNPLDLSPSSVDPNFYGIWVALYGVTGVNPPPPPQLTFSKGETFDYDDDNDKEVADQIQIDTGYGATNVNVSLSAMANDNKAAADVYVDVAIGGTTIHLQWPKPTHELRSTQLTSSAQINTPATGSVNFTVYGRNIDQMSINIELVCASQQILLDQWKLQTYEKIVDAYNNLLETYTTAIAARKIEGQTVGPLGSSDPAANIQTAQTELKRASIAIFDNNNKTVEGTISAVQLYPAVAQNPPDITNPQLPEPILDMAQSLGSRVRWFEQAFEWENMAYVLYPYYWGRRSHWVQNLSLNNDDPQFLSFLRAGYARVVVPVRLGFEQAVQFYLNTGLPWLGGDLSSIGDATQNPLYLDVAEEIKSLTGGGYSGEIEVPVGDPWEYVLPTTLIQLRDDGSLPEWHRVPPAGDESDPAYRSEAPDGPWTWLDGPPPKSVQPVVSPNPPQQA